MKSYLFLVFMAGGVDLNYRDNLKFEIFKFEMLVGCAVAVSWY
jgi:hypothetical protein